VAKDLGQLNEMGVFSYKYRFIIFLNLIKLKSTKL
jgi:hypothetical protein